MIIKSKLKAVRTNVNPAYDYVDYNFPRCELNKYFEKVEVLASSDTLYARRL